uniref:Chitin-binding type-2 domain-containing protein n=3 Tax=Clastoptera arizonana TaxID=38151 RepID=A0A1B6BWG6_9HEMI
MKPTFHLLLAVTLCVVVNGQSRAGNRKTSAAQATRTEAPKSDDLTEECPEPNGYFADAYQCDKYYECKDGAITEKLCPDGMVFNDFSPLHEKCDLPFNIDCSQRPERQQPKPTLHCPRLNGYFAHEEDNVCDKFYFCVDGKFNMIQCPNGLVYNEKTGICTWPDEAKKKGCSSQEVLKFSCPTVSMSEAQQHPRYADPEDCQFFYVCINGETPRRNGCKRGQVFDDVTKNCDWPRKVPECQDWYKGIISDEELALLENPKPKPPRTGAAAEAANRRRGGKPSHRVVEEEEE